MTIFRRFIHSKSAGNERKTERDKIPQMYTRANMRPSCSSVDRLSFVAGTISTDGRIVDGERSIRGNLDNDVSSLPPRSPHPYRETVKTRGGSEEGSNRK